VKILVDGVFFQLARTGIFRLWASVLPLLAARPGMEIVVLDRGGAPPVPGATTIAFPAYTQSSTAADSRLLDRVCLAQGADLFLSTYYTTPLTVPSVLVVYDMIPERLGFDLGARAWTEKQTAISYASRFVCISAATETDLLGFYPSIPGGRSIVAHCGIDRGAFRTRSDTERAAFRRRFGLERNYVLHVGTRGQDEPYKNARILFEAMAGDATSDWDLLCIGGEAAIPADWTARVSPPGRVRHLRLSDEDLAVAYAGAVALVVPSLHEGFGLPAIEAMACGCPVIATPYGSLAEVAGGAARMISGRDAADLRQAIIEVGEAERRRSLVAAGLERARRFHWETLADAVEGQAHRAIADRRAPEAAAFHAEWTRLRGLQEEVDTSL
jgi:glycosyltransferase involved in cell wall biosynthesis